MRKAKVLMAVLASLATACVGCATRAALQGTGIADGSRRDAGTNAGPLAKRTLEPAKVVYTAGGGAGAARIAAVTVQPGTGQRYLLSLEWVGTDKEGYPGRYRLIRVDLSTRKAQTLADADEGERGPRHMAYARNGRIATGEERLQGDEDQYRISEREADGRWRAVTDWSGDLQEPDEWSADSKSLLCHQLRDKPHPLTYTLSVLTETAGGNAFVETRLTNLSVVNAVWSADGSHLFAIALCPAPHLVSVDWPSQKETTLLSFGWPRGMSVAEDSGTLVLCTAAADDKDAVWSLQPGGKPELTRVTLPSPSMERAVSPDGKYLAVVLGKITGEGANARASSEGGVAIYGLADAAEYRVPDTAGRNIMMLHWVLGGRGVVYTVVPNGVQSWEEKAMGHQVWLARLP